MKENDTFYFLEPKAVCVKVDKETAMIIFFPAFLFFCSDEKKTSEPKKRKYYYYEYEEGTIRCHIESNNVVTCLDVID